MFSPESEFKLHMRDGWALVAAIIFITFCALPLVPQLIQLHINQYQFDARTQIQLPPGATASGSPFYWQYFFTYHSLCRVLLTDGGENLLTSLKKCTAMNIGYSVNLTDIFIHDNPNATTSSDWDYAKTLTRVTLQRPAALYIIGFVFGIAGIATTLTKIFSRWDVVIGNTVLKFGSVIFLVASMALVQDGESPSLLFSALIWTAIIFMFYMLSVSVVDLWHYYRDDTSSILHRDIALSQTTTLDNRDCN